MICCDIVMSPNKLPKKKKNDLGKSYIYRWGKLNRSHGFISVLFSYILNWYFISVFTIYMSFFLICSKRLLEHYRLSLYFQAGSLPPNIWKVSFSSDCKFHLELLISVNNCVLSTHARHYKKKQPHNPPSVCALFQVPLYVLTYILRPSLSRQYGHLLTWHHPWVSQVFNKTEKFNPKHLTAVQGMLFWSFEMLEDNDFLKPFLCEYLTMTEETWKKWGGSSQD